MCVCVSVCVDRSTIDQIHATLLLDLDPRARFLADGVYSSDTLLSLSLTTRFLGCVGGGGRMALTTGVIDCRVVEAVVRIGGEVCRTRKNKLVTKYLNTNHLENNLQARRLSKRV